MRCVVFGGGFREVCLWLGVGFCYYPFLTGYVQGVTRCLALVSVGSVDFVTACNCLSVRAAARHIRNSMIRYCARACARPNSRSLPSGRKGTFDDQCSGRGYCTGPQDARSHILPLQAGNTGLIRIETSANAVPFQAYSPLPKSGEKRRMPRRRLVLAKLNRKYIRPEALRGKFAAICELRLRLT